MNSIADSWSEEGIVQAPLGQLTWYHLITLQTGLKTNLPTMEEIEKELAAL